ncbi:MAG: SDR family NAD(P)-dependent oxidoreductase [Corynebacterium sp.]|uniref:SDR family NAD(P)-dependent oxidoreductase n=1 Tax=Corynebacterium sp. TaxID=1720 RepID=UPI0026DADBFC|nr:SDR family NAD(P)-dependent oxidoreductase [Corynebacterium sp.]MDO5097237.1 SDR family NAD(P)-dependent oxidoreductase [Corynebacterium sp.]
MKITDGNFSAVVTGGASGLGAATASMLADAGVAVVAFDLESSIAKARETGTAKDSITYLPIDVTDFEQVKQGVEQAAALAPLRVAVNCAGICPSMRIVGRKGSHDPQLFATTINVNLIGTFNVLNAAAGVMASQEPADADGQRGVIINTASVAAFEGQIGQAAYAASKGGVHSLAICAARDLAGVGVRVVAIAPGIVETPMMASISDEYRTELENLVQFPKRMAKPEEYAALVAAIIDNGYLNGETIRIDGALRMPPR